MKLAIWEFPGCPVVRLHVLTAEGPGSISGQETKILQVAHGQINNKDETEGQ